MALRGAMKSARRALGWCRPFSAEPRSSTVIDYTIPTEFMTHKVEPPSQETQTSTDELEGLFRQMYLMRRVEISADTLYKSKYVRGFCHLYDGQEAVCAGMERSLTNEDCVITAYRDHCIHIGRNGTPEEVFGELVGRQCGAAGGKGGSMHLYNKQESFYGGHGIVGTQIPLGVGLGFALKYKAKNAVSVNMYGDGAANQGQLAEALNLAAILSLPVVFVCENNHFGMGTAEYRAAYNYAYYTRGDYVPGMKVDGMDPLAVKKAMGFAKGYAVEAGPIILEMDTYRYHGHSVSDPGSSYRTPEEVSEVRKSRDPIERVKRLLLDNGFTEEDTRQMQNEERRKVDDAMAFAKESPEPEIHELTSHIQNHQLGKSRGVEREQWFD